MSAQQRGRPLHHIDSSLRLRSRSVNNSIGGWTKALLFKFRHAAPPAFEWVQVTSLFDVHRGWQAFCYRSGREQCHVTFIDPEGAGQERDTIDTKLKRKIEAEDDQAWLMFNQLPDKGVSSPWKLDLRSLTFERIIDVTGFRAPSPAAARPHSVSRPRSSSRSSRSITVEGGSRASSQQPLLRQRLPRYD